MISELSFPRVGLIRKVYHLHFYKNFGLSNILELDLIFADFIEVRGGIVLRKVLYVGKVLVFFNFTKVHVGDSLLLDDDIVYQIILLFFSTQFVIYGGFVKFWSY